MQSNLPIFPESYRCTKAFNTIKKNRKELMQLKRHTIDSDPRYLGCHTSHQGKY